jgi:DNA-binding NarL/FixJ family response regulator
MRDPSAPTALRNPNLTRVGILEDNLAYCTFLRESLSESAALEIAFIAHRIEDARAALLLSCPDLLLIDMNLPDGCGLELLELAQSLGSPRTMILTTLADQASVLSAFEQGADGYILKDGDSAQINRDIAAVLGGASPVSAMVAVHLLQLVRRPRNDGGLNATLTARETDVLNMIARGLSYTEAASALVLSHHTVRDHLKSVYRKLSVSSKSEAVYEARQLGLISRLD